MQKGRHLQYATAGVQNAPGMRMNVRSNVRLPDSEAGHFVPQERQPYFAGQAVPKVRGNLTVSRNGALVFLCVLILLFGFFVISRASVRSDLAKKITDMENAILQTQKDNFSLALELEEARDTARISSAAQDLGMVDASGVESVPVYAPDTRPGNQPSTVQTGSSPYAGPNANLIGSR